MPINLNITGDNHAQAVSELLGFVSQMHVQTTAMANNRVPAPAQPLAPPVAAQPAAPKPAAPQPPAAATVAAAPAAAAAAPAAAPAAPAAEPAKGKGKKAAAPAEKPAAEVLTRPTSEEPTLDNARNWIQFVNQEAGKTVPADGLKAAAKIITAFGVKKVSEIGDDKVKLADFVAKCVAAIDNPAAPAADVASMM